MRPYEVKTYKNIFEMCRIKCCQVNNTNLSNKSTF